MHARTHFELRKHESTVLRFIDCKYTRDQREQKPTCKRDFRQEMSSWKRLPKGQQHTLIVIKGLTNGNKLQVYALL
jgi:hypothetical protein